MQRRSETFPPIVRSAVQLGVAVIGLLILRAVLGQLPMLTDAPAIGDTRVNPLMIVQAVIHTIILLAVVNFGRRMDAHLKTRYPFFRESGTMFNLLVIILVIAIAYNVYGELARALLRRAIDIYSWILLFLILLPIVFLGVLVYRNMDNITDLALRAVRGRAGGPVCPSCGEPVLQTEKFCTSCGAKIQETTPATANSAEAIDVECPSCGLSNSPKASYCKHCGHQLK